MLIGTAEREDNVPEMEESEVRVMASTRLSSLAGVVEEISKPVRHEKLLTVPVILTVARPVLVKVKGEAEEIVLVVGVSMNQ